MLPVRVHDRQRRRARARTLRRIARAPPWRDPVRVDLGRARFARTASTAGRATGTVTKPGRRRTRASRRSRASSPRPSGGRGAARAAASFARSKCSRICRISTTRQAADRRRRGDEIVSAVAAADRLALDRLVGREVGLGDEPAARGHRGGDLVRERAAVEHVRARLRRSGAASPARSRVLERRAGLERQPFGTERSARAPRSWPIASKLSTMMPGKRRADDEALRGELDRRRQDPAQLHRPVLLKRRRQAGHGARDRPPPPSPVAGMPLG